VVVSDHAIVSLWAAHQGEVDLSAVDPALPESALVLRPGLNVLVLRLPPGAARFVMALQAGAGLADAAALAAGEAIDFDLSNVLALLMSHGALTSVQVPRSPRSSSLTSLMEVPLTDTTPVPSASPRYLSQAR